MHVAVFSSSVKALMWTGLFGTILKTMTYDLKMVQVKKKEGTGEK